MEAKETCSFLKKGTEKLFLRKSFYCLVPLSLDCAFADWEIPTAVEAYCRRSRKKIVDSSIKRQILLIQHLINKLINKKKVINSLLITFVEKLCTSCRDACTQSILKNQ